MNVFQVALLGLIQGLTEFIPVSSSGHLTVVPFLFGWANPDEVFIIFMHTGTLIALIFYYRKRLLGYLKLLMSREFDKVENKKDLQYLLKVAIATIITVLTVVFLTETVDRIYENDPKTAALFSASGMIMLGIVFIIFEQLWQRRRFIEPHKLTNWKAAAIGLSQSLAVFRGISRSGITIISGQIAGMSRVDAADFSFMMSIPIITGSTLYGVLKLGEYSTDQILANMPAYLIGATISGVSGYFAIKYMLDYLKKYGLSFFGIYRILFGGFVVILLIGGAQ